MYSFYNTQIAFADKSNKDLNRSYWLFKIMSNNWIVKTGNVLTNAALKLHFPVKGIIKATIFEQFCGGENIEECQQKISTLAQSKIGTILDYSVEGKNTEKDFDSSTNEIILTINASKENPNIPFCVFKVSGIGRHQLLEKVSLNNPLTENEQAEFERLKNRISKICSAAKKANSPLFIDAEESWIQKPIDEISMEMMLQYNTENAIVYTTLQMYRKDRLQILKQWQAYSKSNKFKLGLKIVRGAYLEKERERAIQKGYPSPIHDNKHNTDQDYDAALLFCLENIDQIAFCAATHNEDSCLKLIQFMQEKGLPKNHPHIYFAQLLGMSDHISYNLANEGYHVAKYVPYGPVEEVIPYLIRRAQENTFVEGQTGRELDLIVQEKRRRKMLN